MYRAVTVSGSSGGLSEPSLGCTQPRDAKPPPVLPTAAMDCDMKE